MSKTLIFEYIEERKEEKIMWAKELKMRRSKQEKIGGEP